MNNIIYVGEFDCKCRNKEFSKIFLVSECFEKLMNTGEITTIFIGSRLFLNKNKAICFAEKITSNIHYVHYVNQSYPTFK